MAGVRDVKAAGEPWFRSERILVRPLRLEDIGPAYAAWFADPVVRKFIKFARAAPSVEDLRLYWREKDADTGADFLGIFDAATGAHLGNLKFEVGPAPAEAHVGFLIGDPEARRRGLLRECLGSCVRAVRARRGVQRIYLTVDPDNADARAAFERLGFRPVGAAAEGGDLSMDYHGD